MKRTDDRHTADTLMSTHIIVGPRNVSGTSPRVQLQSTARPEDKRQSADYNEFINGRTTVNRLGTEEESIYGDPHSNTHAPLYSLWLLIMGGDLGGEGGIGGQPPRLLASTVGLQKGGPHDLATAAAAS